MASFQDLVGKGAHQVSGFVNDPQSPADYQQNADAFNANALACFDGTYRGHEQQIGAQRG